MSKWDAIVAAGVGIGAAALYVDTLSPHVALGDAPETVIGVRTLGILHSPGYFSDVLAAKAFGSVVAVGSWTFRTNLFSLVCSALVIVVTYLLARLFGAGRAGAVIGSFALATTVSFWFNAGFAKHYAFSALLVSASALFVVMWQRGGSRILLILAAIGLGAGLGAAWELTLIMGFGVVVLIATGPRRPDTRILVGAAGTFLLVVIAIWVCVLVRARQDPLLNWGDASNPSRLVALLRSQDFAAAGLNGAGPGRVVAALGALERDYGLGAVALAVVGVALWSRRLRHSALWFLGVIAIGDLVAVILTAGFDSIQGFGTSLVQGGYLIDTMLVVAVFVALGATTAIDAAAVRWSGRVVSAGTVVVLVAVAIVPSVLVHHKYANQHTPPYADDYGHSVLAELPPHSVLMVWGEEFSFPMIYRQVIDHERPDVTVLSVNGIGLDWVRAEFTRRLDLGPTLQAGSIEQQVLALIAKLRESRPVYLDTNAMQALSGIVGYKSNGLVGQVVDGVGPHEITDAAAVSKALEQAEDRIGIRPALEPGPVPDVFFFHERAHIELAKAYALAGDLAGATNELQRAVSLFPSDTGTATALAQLRGPGGRDALSAVKNL